MRRAAVLAVVSAMAVIPAAASARQPVVLTQQDPLFAVKPAVIIYTGDATGILGGFDGTGRTMHFGHLHWWRYNHREARARGAVWLDDCVPDCARGSYHPYEVRVRAYKDRRGRFRRL